MDGVRTMGSYSIKDLERLSGIKAHTIRIWEKRYNLISPERTDTNIRFYSDDDLKRIINVSILNNNGIKISKIAVLSDGEIKDQVVELATRSGIMENHVDQLVVSMIDLDEQYFDAMINDFSIKYGFEKTITDIIYPFLEKIGILWQINQIHPSHEHFISNLIRQKILVAIDNIKYRKLKSNSTYLLFLPEGELHEIGLLFYYYVIKKAGHRVIYLGQTVPYEDLQKISEVYSFDTILTSFVAPIPGETMHSFLNDLITDFPDVRIMASGKIVSDNYDYVPSKILPITDLKALLSHI